MSFDAHTELADPERPADELAAVESHDSVGIRSFRGRLNDNITALGEMTAGIAHDFRNVLCVIASGLRVIEEASDDAEKTKFALVGMRQGIERGTRLTQRLLAFAKNQEPAALSEDLNELLTNLRIFLKYGAGPDIRISFELASNLPTCLVDVPQFNAAILNLVVNAREAMPEGGVIIISTSIVVENADATYIRLRVCDDGIGMSTEVRERIFDPYFTTKGEAGTGLGVPQVDALMRHVGGYVTVRSAIGHGTSFDLFFPLREQSSPLIPQLARQS